MGPAVSDSIRGYDSVGSSPSSGPTDPAQRLGAVTRDPMVLRPASRVVQTAASPSSANRGLPEIAAAYSEEFRTALQ
jgi:hypothetical protein